MEIINKNKFDNHNFEKIYKQTEKSFNKLLKTHKEQSNLTGWLNYTESISNTEVQEIKKLAGEIRANADVFIVLGAGGSYLGSKSFIQGILGDFRKSKLEIIFAGNNLDDLYMTDLLNYIKGKSVYINVISKSGETLETLVNFRILYKYMKETYLPQELEKRIIATTENKESTLKLLADKENYKTFNIPENIGGRYSIFTNVAFLPMAVAGIDIEKIIEANKNSLKKYLNEKKDKVIQYSAIRHYHDSHEKHIEIFSIFNNRLLETTEWIKQLFGESEGKEKKGIFPVSYMYTRDLHSLGQYIQDGKKLFFQTMITVNNTKTNIKIPRFCEFDKNKNMINKNMANLNNLARSGVLNAHIEGEIPTLILSMENLDIENLVDLYTFLMISSAISAYNLDLNPFDQPGVEKYKQNIKTLLNDF